MSDQRPVVIRFKSGEEYGLPSASEAKRIYPNAKIVRYQDGGSYEEPVAEDPNTSSDSELVEITVNTKMSRSELERIATELGIEGADNTTAYGNKPALVETINAKLAENAEDPAANSDGETG